MTINCDDYGKFKDGMGNPPAVVVLELLWGSANIALNHQDFANFIGGRRWHLKRRR